jgi:hypothetical protein
MKAVVFHEYGPIDVLKHEDVPTPKPSAGEVLMRVRATAIPIALTGPSRTSWVQTSPGRSPSSALG